MDRRGLVCILIAVCITFLDASSTSVKPSPTATTVKPSPTTTTVKPSPTSTTVKPSPTSTTVKPSPTSTTVKPSPTSTTVKPSPTSTTVKPSPTSTTVKPSPTSTTVKPSPTSTTVKPSPTSTTVKPSPTSTTVKPSPTSTTVKPSPTSTTVKPSPTSTTVKPSPTPTAVKPSTTSIAIPDSFYYNCTDDGGIEIINKGGSLANILVNYLNQTSGSCANPQVLGDGSFKLANCTKNSTVNIVLEATNGTNIIGGHHSKTFQIKCEKVNIEPYFLNVTANEIVGDQSTPHVVTMATKSTPSPVTNLVMTIKDNITAVTEASIGQPLTIAITVPDKMSIKPTLCKATGNDKDVTLWQETGCQYDKELFGEKWEQAGNVITNTMYGFRFVGVSKSITITCTVRVCPAGYKGNECDLQTCTKKRKRINRLSDDVTMEKATASLAIKDPRLTSGAARLGYELSNIISLFAAAALVFVNAKFIRG
ncbi:mucin-2-like [Pecten maximus]|uniref:mucin-2-like n=1 Tax=Pecten maximus TaxID=6579 RepID=UPI0014588038|nr:mucin-2-like [Pecten maximus]